MGDITPRKTETTARRRATEAFGKVVFPKERRPLVDVGRREAEGKDLSGAVKSMTPDGLPVPEILLFALTKLLPLECFGPFEKVRWMVPFEVDGAIYCFELRKFGLRFQCEPNNIDSPRTREVLGRARALCAIAETYLSKTYAPQQLNEGNVTIVNLWSSLDFRYTFLRDQAKTVYGPNPGSYAYFFEPSQVRGSALASAAIDAYFSRIEHLFVLALAFIGNTVEDRRVQVFLASSWTTKAKTLLPLASDPVGKLLYDKISEIRRMWRNPLAHGGLLAGGASLHFHVAGVGALPAMLTRTPEGVMAGFSLPSANFDEILGTLSEFDDYLENGPLRYPMLWAKSGLDVFLDQKSRDKYRSSMKSEEEFQQLVIRSCLAWERHVNMDY